ncbi:hypothetical protein BCR34DRAFT_588901 [Clohesyomyces aquaticus]|uniref:Uncharacterized protein n=1 Tax=Clohesyomyces aquaticus TaxID=1231657 RepID=A0A1Y1ZIR9_9PLEO|nr:hypothetical protein BCR34DRAFT_588901 [Clohesyomyces aquaticus]
MQESTTPLPIILLLFILLMLMIIFFFISMLMLMLIFILVFLINDPTAKLDSAFNDVLEVYDFLRAELPLHFRIDLNADASWGTMRGVQGIEYLLRRGGYLRSQTKVRNKSELDSGASSGLSGSASQSSIPFGQRVQQDVLRLSTFHFVRSRVPYERERLAEYRGFNRTVTVTVRQNLVNRTTDCVNRTVILPVDRAAFGDDILPAMVFDFHNISRHRYENAKLGRSRNDKGRLMMRLPDTWPQLTESFTRGRLSLSNELKFEVIKYTVKRRGVFSGRSVKKHFIEIPLPHYKMHSRIGALAQEVFYRVNTFRESTSY